MDRISWKDFNIFFFYLEKRSGELKIISSLDINGILKISTFVADFYQKLHTSSFHSESSNQFFFEVEQYIPKRSEDNYAVCEGEITGREG